MGITCYLKVLYTCQITSAPVKATEYSHVILTTSTADWAMVEVMTIRHNAWGYSRYILKDSLKYVPLYGLALWMVCGCVNMLM